MTRSSEIDRIVRGLLPLESYRSPWLPTRSLGRDVVIAVAAPARATGETAAAPSAWFAAAPDFSRLLAFSATDVVSPVRAFEPGPTPVRRPSQDPRDAHAFLWASSADTWPAFFAGQPVPSEVASGVEAAVEATVPARLDAWLRLCCADFFAWLDASRTG